MLRMIQTFPLACGDKCLLSYEGCGYGRKYKRLVLAVSLCLVISCSLPCPVLLIFLKLLNSIQEKRQETKTSRILSVVIRGLEAKAEAETGTKEKQPSPSIIRAIFSRPPTVEALRARLQVLHAEADARNKATGKVPKPFRETMIARIQYLEEEAKNRTKAETQDPSTKAPNPSTQALTAHVQFLEAEAITTKEDVRHKKLEIQNLRATMPKSQANVSTPITPSPSTELLLACIKTLETEARTKVTEPQPNILKAQVNVEPTDNEIRKKFAKLDKDFYKLVSTHLKLVPAEMQKVVKDMASLDDIGQSYIRSKLATELDKALFGAKTFGLPPQIEDILRGFESSAVKMDRASKSSLV